MDEVEDTNNDREVNKAMRYCYYSLENSITTSDGDGSVKSFDEAIRESDFRREIEELNSKLLTMTND